MFEKLRQDVFDANMELWKNGLTTHTWGNVSGIDRMAGIMAIKPTGIDYASMTPGDMGCVSIRTGRPVDGDYEPAGDVAVHLTIYQSFQDIGGIAHAHSPAATAWAQSCTPLPALGMTLAVYFRGTVPCTRLC